MMITIGKKSKTFRQGISGLLLLFQSGSLYAHSPVNSEGEEFYAAVLSAILLGTFWLLYLIGSRRIRPSRVPTLLFHSGLIICYLAILGPLDEWAETSATAHMVQHMTLMVIVAPLWVLASPLPQFHACGPLWVKLWQPLLKLVRYPMLMAYIHGATIWFWHLPYFYLLALDNIWWHVIEHVLFIITAGLFWWAVLKSSVSNAHWALLASLLTLMHTGFLGALLTFANMPLYGDTRSLEDQQLAGLIMWVAGAIPYLAAACHAAQRWYQQLLRRMGTDHETPVIFK